MSNSGKGLIAIGLILLAIAVLLLSQNNEHFDGGKLNFSNQPVKLSSQILPMKLLFQIALNCQ